MAMGYLKIIERRRKDKLKGIEVKEERKKVG